VNSEGAFLTADLRVLNTFYLSIEILINCVVNGTINNRVFCMRQIIIVYRKQ